MAFRARKVFGTFEKRAPGPSHSLTDCACACMHQENQSLCLVIQKIEGVFGIRP